MTGVLHGPLRVEKRKLSKLVQFGLFGLLPKMGLGIGFSASDVAADAPSLAVAARRFLKKRLLKGNDEKWLSLARKAFNIETLEYNAWRTDEPPEPAVQLLTLSEPETSRKAVGFSKAGPDAAAANMFDGVEALREIDRRFCGGVLNQRCSTG